MKYVYFLVSFFFSTSAFSALHGTVDNKGLFFYLYDSELESQVHCDDRFQFTNLPVSGMNVKFQPLLSGFNYYSRCIGQGDYVAFKYLGDESLADECPNLVNPNNYPVDLDTCTIVPPDQDGDGFPDDIDDCPIEYSTINNGCPQEFVPYGYPPLGSLTVSAGTFCSHPSGPIVQDHRFAFPHLDGAMTRPETRRLQSGHYWETHHYQEGAISVCTKFEYNHIYCVESVHFSKDNCDLYYSPPDTQDQNQDNGLPTQPDIQGEDAPAIINAINNLKNQVYLGDDLNGAFLLRIDDSVNNANQDISSAISNAANSIVSSNNSIKQAIQSQPAPQSSSFNGEVTTPGLQSYLDGFLPGMEGGLSQIESGLSDITGIFSDDATPSSYTVNTDTIDSYSDDSSVSASISSQIQANAKEFDLSGHKVDVNYFASQSCFSRDITLFGKTYSSDDTILPLICQYADYVGQVLEAFSYLAAFWIVFLGRGRM